MASVALPEYAQERSSSARVSRVAASPYHLTKLGWRDIVVVEQGPLFETGGSTSHAPGLVFQVNPSKTMMNFARYTVDLWKGLELEGEPCVRPVGSLEVAWTPERLADLKRRAGFGMSWGVDAHLINPSEARDLIPALSDRILGALYVPSDIQTQATRPAEAMAREAERNGATFYGNVKVTGLDISDGRINAVHTTRGDIETDLVVSAAGIWARRIGGMAGVSIPLSPMQHLYAVTTPVEELAGATDEVVSAYSAPSGRGHVLSPGWRVLRHRLLQSRTAAGGSRRDSRPRRSPNRPRRDAVHSIPLREGDGCGGQSAAEPKGRGTDPQVQRPLLLHQRRIPCTRRVARRSRILVRPGRMDNARRRRR